MTLSEARAQGLTLKHDDRCPIYVPWLMKNQDGLGPKVVRPFSWQGGYVAVYIDGTTDWRLWSFEEFWDWADKPRDIP